ncbi:MAG: hypothetical protein GQ569_04920 [Methylococcaceae bacterium]|nr:hypothetical protein [Methylococcaceae bacterium]
MSFKSDVVTPSGGKLIPFNQLNYMQINNVNAMYHQIEIDDGAARLDSIGQCSGLSAAFLVLKKMGVDLSTKDFLRIFLDFIKTGNGAAIVASVQLDVEKAYAENGAVGAESAIADFLTEGVEGTSLKHHETVQDRATQNYIYDFVQSNTGYYMIGFNTHECAVYYGELSNGSTGITFFEPNRGFVHFSAGTHKIDFKNFLGLYFQSNVGNSYVNNACVLSGYR